MKKLLLLSIVMLALGTLTAQTPMEKQEKRFKDIVLPAPADPTDFAATWAGDPNPYVSTLKNPDLVIGKTRYDLQSNYSMATRIHAYPDGSIGGTWTYGMLDAAAFSDRGTGYNYFNGTTWGAMPTARIEPVRTGWPSYQPYGPNGEIVVSHTGGTAGLIFSWRATKGTGTWNNFYLTNPPGVPSLLWPRMVTSGVNNQIIHVIYLTAPTANGGIVWEGLNGALLYSRSTNGGASWDKLHVLLDGLTANDARGFSADQYAFAAPVGDKLAFVTGNGYGDGIVLKSLDGGDSWTNSLYYQSIDKFMDGFIAYPRHGGTDSYQSAVIDDLGRVHVAVGRQIHITDGLGARSYYPYSNGLLYWNETMAPLDTTKIGNVITLTNGVSPGYLLAKVFDNGVDTLSALLVPNYYASTTSMPQLAFDHTNKILYAFYAAISPGFVNSNGENYRHIWYRFSQNYGQTWSPYTDLNNDIFHLFSECVYPSLSSRISDKVHMIYQVDGFVGGSNRPTPGNHVHVDNNMVYLAVNRKVGITENQPTILSIDQIFPNPANEIARISIKVDKPLNADVSLVNLLGQQIEAKNHHFGYIGTHLVQFDVSQLETGIYFVNVKSGNQTVTKKLVVK